MNIDAALGMIEGRMKLIKINLLKSISGQSTQNGFTLIMCIGFYLCRHVWRARYGVLAQHETERRRRAVLGADEGKDVGDIRVPVWKKSHPEQQSFPLHSSLPVVWRTAWRGPRCGSYGPEICFVKYSRRSQRKNGQWCNKCITLT